MSAEDKETLPTTYNKIVELLAKLNKEADFNTRLSLIESQYKKQDEIDKMIWNRIDQNETNNNKNRINWTAILQGVLISVISVAVAAYLLKGLT